MTKREEHTPERSAVRRVALSTARAGKPLSIITKKKPITMQESILNVFARTESDTVDILPDIIFPQ